MLKTNRILTSLLFLIGVGILLYPFVSSYIAGCNSIGTIQRYDEHITELSEKEVQEEWEKAITYNNNLLGNPVKDPFVPGSGMVLSENYEEVLNIDGIMGYVKIPDIHVDLPIRHGTSESVLREGTGHVEQTALPIGGKGFHSVIAGHTGLPSAKLLTDLTLLKEGSVFFLYVLDKKLTYEIDQIKVIDAEEFSSLKAEKGKDYVTILTCTPYGVNSHRLLVRGSRIPNQEKVVTVSTEIPYGLMIAVALFLLLLIIIKWRMRCYYNGRN